MELRQALPLCVGLELRTRTLGPWGWFITRAAKPPFAKKARSQVFLKVGIIYYTTRHHHCRSPFAGAAVVFGNQHFSERKTPIKIHVQVRACERCQESDSTVAAAAAATHVNVNVTKLENALPQLSHTLVHAHTRDLYKRRRRLRAGFLVPAQLRAHKASAVIGGKMTTETTTTTSRNNNTQPHTASKITK